MRAACLNAIRDLAKRDPRVVFIGSDLSPALTKSETPDRWFMEGVAEQNMIGMAAGMAMDGLMPYCNTIATFITRRCYDQVVVDLCMHNLPVRLIGNGGGLVYSPLGPTHLAIEDIAIMRALPHMTVVAPCDAKEMVEVMEASLGYPGPMYIRLARGGEEIVSDQSDRSFAMDARPLRVERRSAVTFMSTGVMAQNCLKAAVELSAFDIECSVIHFPMIKPLDWNAVVQFQGTRLTVTVEEGSVSGGLGTAVSEVLMSRDGCRPVLRMGIGDCFPASYGTREDLWEESCLLPEQIADAVIHWLTPTASRPASAPVPRPRSLLPVQRRVLGAPSWVE